MSKKDLENRMNQTMLEKRVIERALAWKALRNIGRDVEKSAVEDELVEAIEALDKFKIQLRQPKEPKQE